ncbi:hypothetical protein BBO_00693 [Beauveria brongniartii RCEF 3172]|uniref:Uncharacterized protein n=1 Tax=Beauveria brongniartii RCEF 3172 TaxID=1081107 RepID=A0A167JTU1_9HYPO|nr:hypothetical protein BBO_00693 [Beauveria brongniartii RCEF 3172]
MPVREQIRVETKSFAPGVLPLSARTFRFVACLRIVTGDDIPLRFVCLITAAFYNDDGQPVWSRRVLIYKIDPGNHHTSAASQDLVEYQRFPESQQSRAQEEDDDATSSTSNDSQLISHLTQEEYHQQLSHRCEDRTPVAQYNHQHRPVGYHLHPQYQGHTRHQIHTNNHTSPHPQAYLTPNCAIHSLDTLLSNQHLAAANRPSSTGNWYTSFNPQERRWVNTWQPN